MNKIIISIVSIIVFLSAFVSGAYAVDIPSFPSCTNPQGQVKANYDNGIHGVVGDSNTYSGKDTVYTVNENSLTQCLCTTNGAGIQTNWLKASSYTQEEINVFVNQGWIFVPNGSSWGLSQDPYLAKNLSYTCSSTTRTGSSDDTRVGGISSTNNSILSLASTGNTLFIAIIFSLGLGFIFLGIISSKKRA